MLDLPFSGALIGGRIGSITFDNEKQSHSAISEQIFKVYLVNVRFIKIRQYSGTLDITDIQYQSRFLGLKDNFSKAFHLVITDLENISQNAEVPMGLKQPGPTISAKKIMI